MIGSYMKICMFTNYKAAEDYLTSKPASISIIVFFFCSHINLPVTVTLGRQIFWMNKDPTIFSHNFLTVAVQSSHIFYGVVSRCHHKASLLF